MSNMFATASVPVENYTTEIQTPRHRLIADEPTDKGGQNSGATPREMLLASLASCTAITIKMYARRKEWDVSGIEVHCELIENADRKVPPKISRVVRMPSALGPEQKERLLNVANACPVHKMLEASVDVETTAG